MKKTDGRKMPVGDDKWDIIGPDPDTVFADGISELRVIDWVVYFSLCQQSVDADNPGQIRIAARVRMPKSAAQQLAVSILNGLEKSEIDANTKKNKAN